MADTKTKKEEQPKKSASTQKKETKREEKKEESGKKTTAHKEKTEEKKEQSFFTEATENIEEGAKVVGEKATEIAEDVFDQLKKGISQAYIAGGKAVDELTQTAQKYAEKYKNLTEMRKLNEKRDALTTKLGSTIFMKYKLEGIEAEKFLKEKDIMDLLKKIERVDKEIIDVGKKLEHSK